MSTQNSAPTATEEWPTNKIGTCPACHRTRPLAEIGGRVICRECVPEVKTDGV